MRSEPTITERCAVTGLDLDVTLAGLLDSTVELVLLRAGVEHAAVAEDIYAHRLTRAAARYRRLADLLDRAEPDVARWRDARARALADRLAREVAA